MSVTVTLHIFSGRPDPTWELSSDECAALSDLITRTRDTTLAKPLGVTGYGTYRGFSVIAVREPAFDPHIYVHGGIIDVDRFAANRTGNGDVERWLLATGGGAIADDLRQFVETEIETSVERSRALARFRVEPPFNPGKWNNDANIKKNNNCYNYANDKITNSFAQPGRGSGQQFSTFACANVGDASRRDGQVSIASPSSTPAQGHYIALVIWPSQDYHWYRRDSNGNWSHKRGESPCQNVDESGRPIQDPRTCDRGPYTEFCGYYHCIPANTKIA